MTKTIKYFYEAHHKFDAVAERFFFHHLYLGLLTVFIGTPIFILAAITISTTVIMLPFAFLLGWL